MKLTPRQKPKFSSTLMLMGIAVLVMSVAFVGVPALAKRSGISETHLTYLACAICFFVAIYASRAIRKLTEGGGKK